MYGRSGPPAGGKPPEAGAATPHLSPRLYALFPPDARQRGARGV